MKILLNPALKPEELRSQLIETGRLRVENLLTDESAEAILESLANQTDWHLVYTNETSSPVRVTGPELKSFSSDNYAQITQSLHKFAPSSYQYIYKFFPIIDAINRREIESNSMLFKIAEFFNGTEFMKFAREITGSNTIVKFDTKATLFEGGHFLNAHDDVDPTDLVNGTRRYAAVVGLTKNWSPNWGGQTNFFNGPDDREFESWNPTFNTLNIFSVPVLHSVSYVVPYAPVGRYSITGWLREDSSIHRPDLA